MKNPSDRRSALAAGRSIFPLLIFGLLFSCAGALPAGNSSGLHIIDNVPFYPQKAYQCGPASLAGVLNYHGEGVSPEDISRQIYSESAGGTLNMDMVLFAVKRGFAADQYKGSFKDIKSRIDSGYPLIVMVDYGFWIIQRNHFMVVVGYNEDGVIVNSGREQRKFIPLADFLQTWKRTEFWSLLVKPE